MVIRILRESFIQAFHQLRANKLRTILSLLGITIGIVCIISVLSAVGSLEHNIMKSLEKLGDDVVYVSKWSWAEDPGSNWWKFMNRPDPNFADYKKLTDRSDMADKTAYASFIGNKVLKYKSNTAERIFMISGSYHFPEIFNLEFDRGRFMSPVEYDLGTSRAVLGAVAADALFGNIDPIGKTIKVSGRKYKVIGTFKKSGKSILQIMDFDEVVLIGHNTARNFYNVKKNRGSAVYAKAKEGIPMQEFKGELTSILRSHRRLSPKEKDNFSLNTLSILENLFDSFFRVLTIAGWIIGGFAMIVGVISVANIMFVSVSERTNLIGIKKALGAKRSVILSEFLIESVVLCVLGGTIGLMMVFLLAQVASQFSGFEFFVNASSIFWGVAISIISGILAGFIPAVRAARMDPVVAIRG